MFLYSYLIVYLFHFFNKNSFIFGLMNQNSKYYNYFYFLLYLLFIIPFIYYPMIWSLQFPLANSMIICCEQTRFVMKCHAFFVETFKTRNYYLNKNKNKTQPVWLVDINLQMADQIAVYTYFLFAPILIYRTDYPRDNSIYQKSISQ